MYSTLGLSLEFVLSKKAFIVSHKVTFSCGVTINSNLHLFLKRFKRHLTANVYWDQRIQPISFYFLW